MKNLKNPAVMGKEILKLIEKNKLLLLQDKTFPNIVQEIVGHEIKGSWWGHPLANPIYNGLNWLQENHSVLVIKLISEKVTYVHESLFSDLYSIVCKPQEWQTKKLKTDEIELLKYILKKTKVTSDDIQIKQIIKDSKKSLTVLEKKLLVYSEEMHTDSGKHIKEFKTWKNSKIFNSSPKNSQLAQENIEKIVKRLNEKTGANAKLPWS